MENDTKIELDNGIIFVDFHFVFMQNETVFRFHFHVPFSIFNSQSSGNLTKKKEKERKREQIKTINIKRTLFTMMMAPVLTDTYIMYSNAILI